MKSIAVHWRVERVLCFPITIKIFSMPTYSSAAPVIFFFSSSTS